MKIINGDVENPTEEEMACIGLRNLLIERLADDEFNYLLKIKIFEGSKFGEVMNELEEYNSKNTLKKELIPFEPSKDALTCCMCGEEVTTQSLEQVIIDKTNDLNIIQQARMLIEFGHSKEDVFCQDCFWK